MSDITSGSTIPIWYDKARDLFPHFTSLSRNEKADVCVVGGGIAGLTSAYMLASNGYSVVLLEDGEIASGESGRTTAHIFNGMDDRYFNLESDFGKSDTRLVAESHMKAIDKIEEIITKENIDCEFARLDGYLFLGPKDSVNTIHKEFNAAKNAGVEVEMVDSVPDFSSGPAIRFPNQGQFQPLLYYSGLVAALLRRHVRIYTHSHAKEFHGGESSHVTTADGYRVDCKHIVVATNVPVNDRVTMYLKLKAYRSYVITAKIPKGSVSRSLYWDTHDPYHYARITAGDDSENDIIIIGGEDHPTGQAHDMDQRYQHLEEWARAHFPSMGTEITSRWSGQITEPVDWLGFMGRNPGDYDNVYIITGDSGQGMTHCTLGAMIITDLIKGQGNPYEKLYDPARKPYHEVKEFIKENLNTQMQYAAWLTGGDVGDIEDLLPGCGAVMRTGLSKLAVYKDELGHVHACSAVCPHLGGIVAWNPSEKSWDCPVHGSRFDKTGAPINGPCNVGLKLEDVQKVPGYSAMVSKNLEKEANISSVDETSAVHQVSTK